MDQESLVCRKRFVPEFTARDRAETFTINSGRFLGRRGSRPYLTTGADGLASFPKPPLQPGMALSRCRLMLKKIFSILCLPLLLLTGCTATFSNLTPQTQFRNENNLYPVEVAMNSRQQALRWSSIKPQIMVGKETYAMRPTLMMTNRWEGLVPVPRDANIVHYRYKFDFNVNSMGGPESDSAISSEYTIKFVDK